MSVILNEVLSLDAELQFRGEFNVLRKVFEARVRRTELKVAQDRLDDAQLAFYEAKEDLQQSGEWADGEIDKLIKG